MLFFALQDEADLTAEGGLAAALAEIMSQGESDVDGAAPDGIAFDLPGDDPGPADAGLDEPGPAGPAGPSGAELELPGPAPAAPASPRSS